MTIHSQLPVSGITLSGKGTSPSRYRSMPSTPGGRSCTLSLVCVSARTDENALTSDRRAAARQTTQTSFITRQNGEATLQLLT